MLAAQLIPLATLRTGGATGADNAFLAGAVLGGHIRCPTAPRNVELYLPWKKFNDHQFGFLPSKAAFDLAAKYHPRGNDLSRGVRCFMARNMHIALGALLNDPVCCVVCWTKNGETVGGTGQVLRWAAAAGVKTFNLHHPSITDEEILNHVRS